MDDIVVVRLSAGVHLRYCSAVSISNVQVPLPSAEECGSNPQRHGGLAAADGELDGSTPGRSKPTRRLPFTSPRRPFVLLRNASLPAENRVLASIAALFL